MAAWWWRRRTRGKGRGIFIVLQHEVRPRQGIRRTLSWRFLRALRAEGQGNFPTLRLQKEDVGGQRGQSGWIVAIEKSSEVAVAVPEVPGISSVLLRKGARTEEAGEGHTEDRGGGQSGGVRGGST